MKRAPASAPGACIPRGYVGRNHETIGSDILAVLGVVTMPEHTLGARLHRQVAAVKPDAWYPIALLLELTDELDQRLGANALRQMGRRLFELSHEAFVKDSALTGAQVIGGFDGLYRRANRGELIGGWRILSFQPGRAVMEKTTPHHCALEEGIVTAAMAAVGIPATVGQQACLRRGSDACTFVVTSFVSDGRWGHLVLEQPGG